MSIYAVLTGLSVAVLVVYLGNKWKLERKPWMYPLLLASFPVYYWVFGLYAMDYDAFIQEFLIGLAFLAWALLAFRLSTITGGLVLAMGFIAHGLYDIVHNSFFINDGAPIWWAEFCGVIDVFIGCYLVYFSLRIEPSSPEI